MVRTRYNRRSLHHHAGRFSMLSCKRKNSLALKSKISRTFGQHKPNNHIELEKIEAAPKTNSRRLWRVEPAYHSSKYLPTPKRKHLLKCQLELVAIYRPAMNVGMIFHSLWKRPRFKRLRVEKLELFQNGFIGVGYSIFELFNSRNDTIPIRVA